MRRSGKPTNLYLCQALKIEAIKVAETRYNCSLSAMVERLLRREIALKRGLLGSVNVALPEIPRRMEVVS